MYSNSAAAVALDTAGASPVDVVFGGLIRGNSATFATQLWDGVKWTALNLTSLQSPAARGGAMMAYDPAIGKVILYGGWNGSSTSTVMSDTWSWNGTAWTKLTPTTNPGPLAFGSMVWDNALGKLVLFGGATAPGNSKEFNSNGGSFTGAAPTVSNQTWTFDGTTWTKLTPATSPSARSAFAAGYDTGAGKVVLFGGYDGTGTTLGDTWTFDGTTWTQQAPVNAPAAASGAAMAYDSALGGLVMFGGYSSTGAVTNGTSLWDSAHSSWMWDANDVTATARADVAMAPAAVNGQLFQIGGYNGSNAFYYSPVIFDWGSRGLGTGDSVDTVKVNDHLSITVDLGSGNAVVQYKGSSLAGNGLDLQTGATFNSQNTLAMGKGWVDSPWAQTIHYGPAGSIEIDGLNGQDDQTFFTANGSGGFTSPPGLDGTLAFVSASNTFTLTVGTTTCVFAAPADDGTGTPGQLTSIQDSNGHTIAISGSLTTGAGTVTDTRGRTVTRAVSSGKSTWTLPDGRTWSEGAVSAGYQSFTDANGKVTQFGYDGGATPFLDIIIDPDGSYTTLSWTGSGQIASIVQHLGSYTANGPTRYYGFGVAPAGVATPSGTAAVGASWVTDPDGHTTRYLLQYNRQSIATVNPLAGKSTATYNADEAPTTSTDENGNTTTANYTSSTSSDPTAVTAPASGSGVTPASSTSVYNTPSTVTDYQHLPSSTTDPQGNCTSFVYDTAGQVTDTYAGQAAPCDGLTGGVHTATRYQGDPGVTSCGGTSGAVCATISGNGNTTTNTYDSLGQLTSSTPPAPAAAIAYTYDSSSRIATISDGNGTRTFSYDPDDRVTQVLYGGATSCTASPANCVKTTYDADGYTTQQVSGAGTSTWTYDSAGRVLKENAPGAPTNTCSTPNDTNTVYQYDDLGELLASCSSNGTTSYNYDSAGNLLTDNAPITQVGLTHEYQAIGSADSVTLPSSTQAGDVILAVVTTTGGATAATPSGYTLAGTYTTGNATQTVFTKVATSTDSTLRVTISPGASNSATMVGVYRGVNTSSPIDAITSAGGTGTSLTLPSLTTTGASDRLVLAAGAYTSSMSYASAFTPAAPLSAEQTSVEQWAAAALASQTLTAAGPTGTRTTSFPISGALEGVLIALKPANATGVPAATHTYDAAGNQLTTAYPSNITQTTTYSTDNLPTGINAVNTATSTTLQNLTYTWTKASHDTDVRQSMTDVLAGRTTAYTYDSFGQLTEAKDTAGGTTDNVYTYDADTNMTSHTVGGTTTTMAVNAADQLCWTYTGTTSNTCSTAPTGATTYTYDAAGNRTGSSAGFAASYNALGQTTSITPAGGTATPMTYAGDGQDTRLTAGSTGYVNTTTGVATSTTGSSTTTFVTEPDGHLISLTAGGATYNYLYDAQGNITGLTDSAGTQQAAYAYDPYGNTTATGPAAALNPFRFAGGYQDSTGLYHFGARYYDPTTARWTQIDPSAQDPAYTYSSNNPINASDLTGLATRYFTKIQWVWLSHGWSLYVYPTHWAVLAFIFNRYAAEREAWSQIVAAAGSRANTRSMYLQFTCHAEYVPFKPHFDLEPGRHATSPLQTRRAFCNPGGGGWPEATRPFG